jgi:hypothetical protein
MVGFIYGMFATTKSNLESYMAGNGSLVLSEC